MQTDTQFDLAISRTEPVPAVPRRERWLDGRGHLCAWGSPTAHGCRIAVDRIGVFSFSRDSEVVAAQVHRSTSEREAESAFERVVLPLLVQFSGWQVLHASAVIRGHHVVALCGRSGAGKSTFAHYWCRTEARPFADDAVAFRVEAGEAAALRLPAETHRPRDGGGLAVQPLQAVCVLEPTEDRPAGLALQRPSEALHSLLGHAVALSTNDPDLRRVLFDGYVDLARSTPVYRLSYRQTAESAAEMVAVLAEVIDGEP